MKQEEHLQKNAAETTHIRIPIERVGEFHPLLKLMKSGHDAASKARIESEEALLKYRESQDKMTRLAAPQFGLKLEEITYGNINVLITTPEQRDTGSAILYCHGGGYNCGGLGYASVLSCKLARNTGRRVYAHEYRLSPEFPYPAAIEDTCSMWDALLDMGYTSDKLVVAGDSAGGNLALELCVHLKEQKRELPGLLVLMSPWTNMETGAPSYQKYRDLDPILNIEYIEYSRSQYLQDACDYRNPHYSPLFANLKGYPPTLIQAGAIEILRSDSERLARRLKAAGTEVEYKVFRNSCHVFQQLPTLQASHAMADIGVFVNTHMPDESAMQSE